MTPEAEILLTCARVGLTQGESERIDRLLRSDPDWGSLLRLAARHSLSPLLYSHLRTASTELVPKRAMAELWSCYEATLKRNAAATDELLRVLQILKEGGIDAIPFKGPALGTALYGDVGLRPFNDLDIVLRRSDVLPAKKLLLSAGYHAAHALEPEAEAMLLRSRTKHDLTVVHDQRDLLVELHWRTHAQFPVGRIADEQWWAEVRRVPLGGTTVRSFSREELLLLLCIHGAQHEWESLHWLVDVAELIRRQRRLDWTDVTTMAHDLACERRLGLGLRLAHDLLEAPVPQAVRMAPTTRADTRAIEDTIRGRLVEDDTRASSTFTQLGFQLGLNDQWPQSLRLCLILILSPGPAEWSRWPLPRPLTFLYVPLHVFRLVTTYGSKWLTGVFGAPATNGPSDTSVLDRPPAPLT